MIRKSQTSFFLLLLVVLGYLASVHGSISRTNLKSRVSSNPTPLDFHHQVVGQAAKIYRKIPKNGRIESVIRLSGSYFKHRPNVNFLPQGYKPYANSRKPLENPILRGKNNIPIIIDLKSPVIGNGFEGTVVPGYTALGNGKVQKVAVKIVDYDPQRSPKLLKRESRNLEKSSLLHSPVVIDAKGGKAYIPMKLVKGDVLEKKAMNAKDETEFMSIVKEAMSIVSRFHAKTGLAHNDLHGNNIILPSKVGSPGGGLVDLSRASPLNSKFGRMIATKQTDNSYLMKTFADLAAFRFGSQSNLVQFLKDASQKSTSPLI